MRKPIPFLMISLIFLALISCTITGRVTPTPRPTRPPTHTPVSAAPAITLPTLPAIEVTVPPLPSVPVTLPTLSSGGITVPTLSSGLIPALGTLLPGRAATRTPTATLAP